MEDGGWKMGEWRTKNKREKVAKVKSDIDSVTDPRADIHDTRCLLLLTQRERKAAKRNRRPDALYIETEPHERTARGA